MISQLNTLGQPIGLTVPDWQPVPRPGRRMLEGRRCRVEPIDPARHAESLHEANRRDSEARIWTYLPYGPFDSLRSYRAWMEASCLGEDPEFYAVVDRATGRAIGVASYLRIDTAGGVIEVGHICYSPLLQRSVAATEAMYLMMEQVFALGYRRYEWKCDALNAASRGAAERLGFCFEGVFLQATMYKGRNRDTAWYSVIDSEWPSVRAAMQRWLSEDNFDAGGRQRTGLRDLMVRLRSTRPSP